MFFFAKQICLGHVRIRYNSQSASDLVLHNQAAFEVYFANPSAGTRVRARFGTQGFRVPLAASPVAQDEALQIGSSCA